MWLVVIVMHVSSATIGMYFSVFSFYNLDSVTWEKSVASLILPNTLFSIHNQHDAWIILNTSSMTESEMILTGALKEIVWN